MTQSALPPGFLRRTPQRAKISDSDLGRALAVAKRASDRAREEILPRFRRVATETKADGSPVTEADREAEKAIRQTIQEAFPKDAFLGEELGEEHGEGTGADGAPRRRWIVDPIDGTLAFSRGIPLFTTLITLLVDDIPVVALIDLPAVGDRIIGTQGGGCWRDEERVSVSTAGSEALEDQLISHGDLFCFELAGLRPVYDALSHRVRTLRGYTDAFGHLLVLTGGAEAMVDCDLNPWDAAATQLLALEAGGECWVRERENGQKIDLIFGHAATVQAIGKLFPDS